MARSKPKKYSKMGYQQKENYVKDELKKLGSEGVYRQDSGGRGNASTGMFDLEASQEQLQSLASNNYDLRESIKYGKESGDKRFADVGNGGFGNMTELVNANRAVAEYGKKELGQTKTSSVNDYANISSSLFKASREQLTDSMTANEQQDQAERGTAAPVSRELQDARDTVDELGNKDYDIFGANIDNGDNQNQRDQASQAFLGKYKLDLKKDKNFQPVLPS
jgi:hypothetical protein